MKKKTSEKCIMKWLVWTMILFCYKKFKIFIFYLSLHGLRNLFNRHLILTIRSPDYHSSGISTATVKHLISRTLVSNEIIHNSDVVVALHVGAVLSLTPGFSGLSEDNCKRIQETLKLGDLVWLILEVLQLYHACSYLPSTLCGFVWRVNSVIGYWYNPTHAC